MLLARLQLTNFRQYDRLDLQFKDGITGIVGKNGAGKSTILEAVLWCLFGNRGARTDKEGIKRQSAGSAESCSVELEFLLGGKTYTLSRTLVGRSSRPEVRLLQHGKLDAVTTREVDDYIVRLIGLNLKGFLSSFFARQKELNALSDARPADRKDHLAKMLGVGRLDNAVQLLKEDLKSVREKIETLSGLQIDPEAVTLGLNQKKAEIADLERTGTALKDELAQLLTSISHQEKSVETLRKKEQQYTRLDKELSAFETGKGAVEKEIARLEAELAEVAAIEDKIGPLSAQIADLPQVEHIVADLKQARVQAEERKRLQTELEATQKGVHDNRREADALGNTIGLLQQAVSTKEKLRQETAELESRIDRLLKEHQELSGELKVIESNLATMESQKLEIKELGPDASCKMCLRPFAGELSQIERHFDQEILSLREQEKPLKAKATLITEEGKKLRGELQIKKKESEALGKKEQELASAQASLAAVVNVLKDSEKRETEIKKRLDEIGPVEFDPAVLAEKESILKKKLETRDEYIRLAERATRKPAIVQNLDKAGTNLEKTEHDLNTAKAEREKLAFDPDAYQKAVAGLDESRGNAGDIRVKIERLDGQVRLLASEANARAAELEKHKASQKEISRLRETLIYLEKLSLLFNDFRVHLIGRIRPSLSKQTSQLFYVMTAGRYQEIELDEDYALCIYDRGERFPISRFSGGEIDLANLCFRLAISVEMAQSAKIDQSFIILDEIFGSQDTERQRMIFEGLGRLKNRFRQIIIISHIDDVKEMAENIISVEVDSAGISHAVIIGN